MSRIRLTTLLVCALTGTAFGQANTQIKERELAAVRVQIQSLRESLAAKDRSRRALNDALVEAEATLASARRALAETESEQALNTRELATVEANTEAEQSALLGELDHLSTELRNAYMRGRNQRVQLLLNGETPAALGRNLAYFQYMNKARETRIETVRGRLARLDELREAAVYRRNRLSELQAEKAERVATLTSAVTDRRGLLGRLNQEIETAGGQVAELTRREQDLERLILELSSILADYPITSEAPFASHRGKLTWPVNGQLIHDFGQPRDGGEIKWNGVVLAAARGKEVRALYHGRVAFADWLPGLGLLLVIDHGDQYLSLYGHNDSLLKDVGDWVGAGDAIATVGDSGGQGAAGLYLEIRNGKRPLNPRRWISKRPRNN